jgi:hypothetical protein
VCACVVLLCVCVEWCVEEQRKKDKKTNGKPHPPPPHTHSTHTQAAESGVKDFKQPRFITRSSWCVVVLKLSYFTVVLGHKSVILLSLINTFRHIS